MISAMRKMGIESLNLLHKLESIAKHGWWRFRKNMNKGLDYYGNVHKLLLLTSFFACNKYIDIELKL